MELRDLRSFIVLATEGSVSNAAKTLHVTQPTLSRQMAALEDELGQQLFIRTRSGISLTREGHVLLRYADELVDLADRAKEEVSASSSSVVGKVYIAAGETQTMALVARAMTICRQRYPRVHFQTFSGSTPDLWDEFARGRYDLLVECGMQPHSEYNAYPLPYHDEWGALMRRDSPLAEKPCVTPDDLRGQKIMLSAQAERSGILQGWAGDAWDQIEVACNWSLPLNSRFFVREGLGISMVYQGLFDDEGQDLCYRPLSPKIEDAPGLVWRKSPLSRQARLFLDTLLDLCESDEALQAMHENTDYRVDDRDNE